MYEFDFFISYSWATQTELAKGLCARLEVAGFRCFLDRWHLEPLKRSHQINDLAAALARAAGASRYMLHFEQTQRTVIALTWDGTAVEMDAPEWRSFEAKHATRLIRLWWYSSEIEVCEKKGKRTYRFTDLVNAVATLVSICGLPER